MSDIVLAGVPVVAPDSSDMCFVGLIWGPAGDGKTTLASTAPGNKLFLMLDPNGEMSLAGREDCRHILQLYKQNPLTVCGEMKKDDPYGLSKYIVSHNIETVVLDSMTTFATVALYEAVDKNKTGRNAISLEQPSMAGYAYRNSVVQRVANNLLRLCARLHVNLIVTTHEGAPTYTDDGKVESITMILSENLANQMGLRFNEVYHLRDSGGTRTISVRPHTKMKPMKTRMFLADKPQFQWKYDANTGVGDTIESWWHQWKIGGGKKIPLPK
jgi:hypothetical protein